MASINKPLVINDNDTEMTGMDKPTAINDNDTRSAKRKLSCTESDADGDNKVQKLDEPEYSSKTQALSRKFNALIFSDVNNTVVGQSGPQLRRQPARNTVFSKAAKEVFGIPEIMETILMEVPPSSLIVATRASRAFVKTVLGSHKLMARLGFEPAKPAEDRQSCPDYNEALFEEPDDFEQRLVIGGWSVHLELNEHIMLDLGTENTFKSWFLTIHAAPVNDRPCQIARSEHIVMETTDWKKRASMSCMSMLLLDKPVDTVFRLAIPHLPKKSITLPDGSALHTYGELFNHLRVLSQQMADPFILGWFDHWERLEVATATEQGKTNPYERWHPSSRRPFALPKSRLLSLNITFQQYKADYVARGGDTALIGNAP